VTAFACAAVLALGLTACGSSGAKKASGAGPLTLRFAGSSQGAGYPTPFAAIRGPGQLLTTFMFDTLAFPDVTGQPKPWLAQSWQESADGKTWTFQLHPKVTWQDGKPLTSADVVFSFNYDLHGPGEATGVAQGINYIRNVTATGPDTVVIKLKAPEASFLSDIAGAFGVAIIPQHIWAAVSDPAHFQGPQSLIGSGPYRLKTFDLSTGSYDFVANDGFYLGRPTVQQFQIIPENNPLVALQQGQLTSASTSNGVFPQAEFNLLSKSFKLLTAPGEFNEALFFNLAGGSPYNQVDFRHAVAYALNRQDMLDRLADGRGVPGSAGGLGPDNPYLDNNVASYPYDPAKAKALLDQLGIKAAAGATFRTSPDGASLTIPLLASAADIQQAQLVQQYLRAVGLNVQITSVDQPTSDAADASGHYKMAIVHFGGLGSDPSGLIQRFASSSKSKSFTRVTGYHDPAFDKLAAEQATTVDVAHRKQLVDQMQVLLANDLPELPLYIPEQITFVNAKVFHGWAYTPACPPCGAGMNKRMLVSGSAAPAPSNSST
jgi:peptide/nickel transport system substrate-binding protein